MKNLICVLILVFAASSSFAVPFEGQKIVVAGPSPFSAQIAQDIHRQGGNVVDASVAIALALSVTAPYYASLGGGGFALVDMGKGVEALDFREVAPKAANVDLFKDKSESASVSGGLSVAVPGTPAGLKALHAKYGKLPWNALFAAAEKFANVGFRVSGEWSNSAKSEWERFNGAAKRTFSHQGPKADGKPLLPGDFLQQPELVNTILRLRDYGTDGFYKGPVARAIVDTVKANGGIIEMDDLKDYKVRWLKPAETTYQGYKIYMMPLPSSAGVVMTTALKIAEKVKLATMSPLSSLEFHTWTEILRFSFRQRGELGDPDFAKNIPQLDYEKMANDFNAKFKGDRVTVIPPPGAVSDQNDSDTTHFSVLDSEGHSVAMTITLNGLHGSGLMTNKFGIMLNDEMDDFNTHPGSPNMFGLLQGPANNVEPGKRPLSSMSPTLVEKDGKVVLSLGSPGGPRIISSVLQVLHRVLANGWDIDQAIQAPRVHHQYQPDKMFVDKNKFSQDVLDALIRRGQKVEVVNNIAKVYGVQLRKDGILEGAFDSRGEGGAGGL